MIAEVSGKLIDQFVDCIEQELLGEAIIDEVAAESATAPGAAAPPARPRPQQAETLDLMEYAGNSVYKRLIPIAAVIAALIVLRLLLKRR